MEIKIIDSIEKLLIYKTEWDSILKEIDNDILFLELDWIIFWWEFFGDKHELFVLIIISEQKVIGICPLMITDKGMCNKINFIGGRESSRMDFILTDESREEALKCIFNFLRSLKGNNIIELHGMTEKSLNFILLKKCLKVNEVPFVHSSKIFYFLNLKDNDFNTHFEHRFGNRTRQTMSKKEKKLKSLGNLDYKRISTSKIDEVFDIHEKRWLRKIGNSSFSKGDTKEFYKELASKNNMQFNTIVDAMTLNNKIISFIYGFEYNKKYLFIRIAHDDDFYFLSPGELILKKKIEECFFLQMGILDFGAGYEPYKARWTDHYEEFFTTVLPSNNLKSNLIFYFKYLTSIKLIDALKKNKRINNFRKYHLGKLKFLLSKEYISNIILRIKRAVERNGLLACIKKHLMDLTSKIFSYKQYLILGKDLESIEISQNIMQIKEAAIDDLEALSKVMNESPSKVIRRFINKHKCYITLHNSQIIYYCWINHLSIDVSGIELNIPFRKHDVYIYDSFMKKNYKNEYNYTSILSSIFDLLYRENYRKCYITLNNCNRSIENEVLKKIFQPCYKILEKRILSTITHSIVDLKLRDKADETIYTEGL